MNKQPEALRLADAIDPLTRKTIDNLTCAAAAAELRRLHNLCVEWEKKAATWLASPEAAKRLDGYRELFQRVDTLEAALRQAVEALDLYLKMDTMDESYLLEIDLAPKAITAAKKALGEA